ncbi:PIG-L family deacetylase [Thiocystis violacea]|uniref:PIG-L family deacetylase n=1 Tax=Thiocystis violacea TaxID=13725 RepID=UPI0019060643|nr:PIG-L family deacetylase [Thiocystis violacea]
MTISEHDILPYHAERAMPSGRALILAPHPDDEVLGCAGAIMRHIAANDPVRVVIATDGAFGETDGRDAHMRLRQDESRRAAAVLGCDQPAFWELPDRGLEYGESLIERIRAAIDELAADLVYAPSWWEMHPDHFALALAAAEAVRRCQRPVRLVMYEIGVPLHPNRLLDISDLVERKHAALACFASQLAQQRYDEHIAGLNRYRTYTLPGHVLAAEAYRMMTGDELRQDPVRVIRPGVYYTQNGHPSTKPPPLVSVIVDRPGADTGMETLDAITLQTYPNIEILVVPTNAEQEIETPTWRDRYPLRAIAPGDGDSSARAMNRALDAARGDFLVIVQDDAILAPDHVSAMVEALANADGSGCAYSGVLFEGPGPEPHPSRVTLNRRIDRRELWGGTAPPISCFLVARRHLADGCRFDETLEAGQAWDFLVQLSLRTEFLHVDRTSLRVRRQTDRPENRSSSRETLASRPPPSVFEKWQKTWGAAELIEIIAFHDARKAEAERSAQGLMDTLTEQSRTLAQERNEAQALRQAIAQSQAEAHRQRATAEQLHQELQALRRSTSWKITAPLRLLVTRLRGTKA